MKAPSSRSTSFSLHILHSHFDELTRPYPSLFFAFVLQPPFHLTGGPAFHLGSARLHVALYDYCQPLIPPSLPSLWASFQRRRSRHPAHGCLICSLAIFFHTSSRSAVRFLEVKCLPLHFVQISPRSQVIASALHGIRHSLFAVVNPYE